jgi:hypothetical protein
MKKILWISVMLLVASQGCEPDPALSDFEHYDALRSLRLTEPAGRELALGEKLDLRSLLSFTFENNAVVAVPDRVIQYVVNDTPAATPVFEATLQGTYVIRAKIGNKLSNPITFTVQPYTLVRIPVVFHTVNSTLTQLQVERLLKGMTEAFRNRWNPYNGPKDENAVDSFVEFYAADKDPSGRMLPVMGLNAVTSSRKTFTSKQAVDAAWDNYWNPNSYLNVWIYDLDREEKINGFAYFMPVTRALAGLRLMSVQRTSPDLPYGIYYNKADVDNVRSNTLAHEAGHVLGLEHVFDGNGDKHKGCSTKDPDYCADTPFYDRAIYIENYRTQQRQRTACNGGDFVSTNHMDYYLSYANSFTGNQRDRIRHTITYGVWLPIASSRSREGAEHGYVKKPDDYNYVPPIMCALEPSEQ